MKNAVMQHAIANAHKKAEQKTRTVKPGTLSLAGQHNKRSTDNPAGNMQKAEQSMPAIAEAVLAAAAQNLHDTETKGNAVKTNEKAPEKTTEKPAAPNNVEQIFDADSPRIIVREGLRGERLVFFVDSETPQGTIEMFDASSGKAEKETVKVLFYKQATKPMEDAKERDKAVAAVVKAFNFPRVILRSRLVKENSKIHQDEAGKANTVDLDSYKEKLIAAIVKAIREA